MGAEVATWKLKKSIHVYEANLQMVFLATNTRCNSKKKKKLELHLAYMIVIHGW
jgi:hypothetical protein